jgi:hypothetical protein
MNPAPVTSMSATERARARDAAKATSPRPKAAVDHAITRPSPTTVRRDAR